MSDPAPDPRPETREEKLARRRAMPVRRFEGPDPGTLDMEHYERMSMQERIDLTIELSRRQRELRLGPVREGLPRTPRHPEQASG